MEDLDFDPHAYGHFLEEWIHEWCTQMGEELMPPSVHASMFEDPWVTVEHMGNLSTTGSLWAMWKAFVDKYRISLGFRSDLEWAAAVFAFNGRCTC